MKVTSEPGTLAGGLVDLHILGGGAVKGLVAALGGAFLEETGVTVVGKFGAVGSMKDLLVAGEPCDLVVLTESLVADLALKHYVVADSPASLGRVVTGVAVRAGDSLPDIHSECAFRNALLAADEIYLPDAGKATAGIHFVKVLERLGLLDRIGPRLCQYPSGAIAMQEMSRANSPTVMGCTQCTEILYTEGVVLVGALPGELGLSTIYSAGICARSANPGMAARFSALLAGPEYQPLRRAHGFD